MEKLKVRSESLPTRCEICHLADQFEPETGYCARCEVLYKKVEKKQRRKSQTLPQQFAQDMARIIRGPRQRRRRSQDKVQVTPRKNINRPDWVMIEDVGDSLFISLNHTGDARFGKTVRDLLIYLSLPFILYFLQYFLVGSDLLNPIRYILTFFILFLCLLQLLTLFGFFSNRTVIEVTSSYLKVWHKPVTRYNRSPDVFILSDKLKQLYSQLKETPEGPRYVLKAIYGNDKNQLISLESIEIADPAVVLFIEQQIEAKLHIEDQHVPGELPRKNDPNLSGQL